MQALLIALGQAVCLAFLCWLPYKCAALDAKEFTDNPSKDDYGKKFHTQRLVWRGVAMFTAALVCSLPLLPGLGWILTSLVGLLSLGAAWFFYVFNPELSLRRKLPYVDQYYVSFSDTTAAFPDKYIANWVMRRFPLGPGEAVTPNRAEGWRIQAATKLKELMNLFLVLGLGVYSLSLTILLIHLL